MNMSDASVVLRNSIKLETIAGPVTPMVTILDRAHIMLQYGIRLFEDTGVPGKVSHSDGQDEERGVPTDRTTAAMILLGERNTSLILRRSQKALAGRLSKISGKTPAWKLWRRWKRWTCPS
jgi:hypothetical protein